MSSAKMTLIGMNQFFTSLNDDLFKNLTLPEGISKQILTDNILLTGGEFEVLYSNPTAMQNMIGIWSRREQATFERWIAALSIDYNPLENYDRMEHWTDNFDGLEHTANSGTSSDLEHTVNSGTNNVLEHSQGSGSSTSNGGSNTTTSDTSELQKSAYDESGYSAYEKTINGGTVGVTSSDSTTTSNSNDHSVQGNTSDTGDRSNQGTTSNTEDHSTDNDSVHDGRIHGNIGVTTSQQMLQAELDLGYWNIYSKITELFLKEFVIPVYA